MKAPPSPTSLVAFMVSVVRRTRGGDNTMEGMEERLRRRVTMFLRCNVDRMLTTDANAVRPEYEPPLWPRHGNRHETPQALPRWEDEHTDSTFAFPSGRSSLVPAWIT